MAIAVHTGQSRTGPVNGVSSDRSLALALLQHRAVPLQYKTDQQLCLVVPIIRPLTTCIIKRLDYLISLGDDAPWPCSGHGIQCRALSRVV